MKNVKVVLRDGTEKIYRNAEASVDSNKVFHVFHPGESNLAEFQPEYYQYWELTEQEEPESRYKI